jgi:hypothetical protein
MRRENASLRRRRTGSARLPFPGRSAAQARLRASLTRCGLSEVPHCRPGIAASSELSQAPDQRRGISRRTASGGRKPMVTRGGRAV